MTTGAITLGCWTCGAKRDVFKRDDGHYPLRCPRCTTTAISARELCRTARTLGLRGEVHKHDRQGYVCIVKTPWHDDLVIVRDRIDLEWLLAEMRHTGALQKAA